MNHRQYEVYLILSLAPSPEGAGERAALFDGLSSAGVGYSGYSLLGNCIAGAGNIIFNV